jgi:hypothetical protein
LKPQQQFEQRTGKATNSPPTTHQEPAKADSPVVKEVSPVTPSSEPPTGPSVTAARSTFTPAPVSAPPKAAAPASTSTTNFAASGTIKVQQNKCAVCGKTCYPQESLLEDKKTYHKVN